MYFTYNCQRTLPADPAPLPADIEQATALVIAERGPISGGGIRDIYICFAVKRRSRRVTEKLETDEA